MRESLSVALVGEKLLIISTNGDRSKVDKTSIRRWKSGPISFYEKGHRAEGFGIGQVNAIFIVATETVIQLY